MGSADRISGIFWLFFSAFISIESYRLGLGNLHQPGAGFIFFWTAVAMGILSIAVFVRAWFGKKTEDAKAPSLGKKMS